MVRNCSDCQSWCQAEEYSNNQWRKGAGSSRCINCVSGGSVTRCCAECRCSRTSGDFSGNQWSKGPGVSRCSGCVNRQVTCPECYQTFENQNNLSMHMQVHRSKNVACPVCGDERFKSGANAVQHVESGYCTGCLGQDNARNQIYQFANSKLQMKGYLSERPMLTNGSYSKQVPDLPYNCPKCSKAFRQLSQLMQHQDQKHNNHRMLTY